MLERQIGAIIRLNRIHQNISVRGLAEMVGIEYSQLSKIERGMEFSNPLTMESIFDALDLNYHQTVEYIPPCMESIHQLYRDILYRKPRQKIKEAIEQLNNESRKMGLSTSLLLINLIYNVLWNIPRDDYPKVILSLHKVEETMSLIQKQLFYQYQGCYKFSKGESDEAIRYLDLSKTFYMDGSSSAMIAYQKGVIYTKNGDFIDAFECLVEAKHLFEQHHNYIRSAFCSVVIANIHLMTGKYDKSYILYTEMLEVYESFGLMAEDKIIIYNNLLFLSILKKEYQHFMDMFESFDDEIKAVLLKKPHYYYFKMIATYGLGDMDLCKEAIEHFEKLNHDPIDKYMAKYYRLKIVGAKQEELSKLLEKNLKAMDKTPFCSVHRFALRFVLQEHEDSLDYKILYKYALKLAEIKM